MLVVTAVKKVQQAVAASCTAA